MNCSCDDIYPYLKLLLIYFYFLHQTISNWGFVLHLTLEGVFIYLFWAKFGYKYDYSQLLKLTKKKLT